MASWETVNADADTPGLHSRSMLRNTVRNPIWLLMAVSLMGCSQVSPEEVVANFFLWILFLIGFMLLLVVGMGIVLMVLVAPPFFGLVSGLLLRRDAAPRRRMFIVGVGLLNLCNVGLFSWPLVDLAESALTPVEPPATNEDAVMLAIGLGVLVAVNAVVGVYSLVTGLREPTP